MKWKLLYYIGVMLGLITPWFPQCSDGFILGGGVPFFGSCRGSGGGKAVLN